MTTQEEMFVRTALNAWKQVIGRFDEIGRASGRERV